MIKDPIVEEIKKFRTNYAKRFNYDLDEIYKDLKKKEEEAKKAGRKFVNREPKLLKKEAKFRRPTGTFLSQCNSLSPEVAICLKHVKCCLCLVSNT